MGVSDSRMVSRLTQTMRTIIGMDEANDRGERAIDKDNIGELMGFNFNQGAGADVTMSIPALNPATDVVVPQGATHFELLYGAASLNFETSTYQVATVAAPLGIMALNSAALANKSLVASFPAAPTADEVVVGVVGINYYQQLNGKNYPLNNNATNPLAIEYVA